MSCDVVLSEENDPHSLLVEERFAPITSEVGFIEAACDAVVREYVAWQESLSADTRLSVRKVAGQLDDALCSLLPLVEIEATRHLFIPTSGPWTAYVDNGWAGPDVFPVVSFLSTERLNCRGVRAAAERETLSGAGQGSGQYGSVQLDLWGPDGAPPLMYVRSIGVANDGGRWVFEQAGAPLDFEDVTRYESPHVAERFTFAMLQRYLEALGIRAFDSDFYMVQREATLVERARASGDRGRELSLEEVRASRGL